MKNESLYFVTGTFHGAHVYAVSEGEARKIFHKHYNGESITYVRKAGSAIHYLDQI